MAMMTYPMIIEDGHMYAKVTLRDVVEKCDVSDLPILSEVKRLYDENAKLRKLSAEMFKEHKRILAMPEAYRQGMSALYAQMAIWSSECISLGIEVPDA